MRSVEEHRSQVVAQLGVLATERVAVADAAGRVLAEALHSRWSLPQADNSAMDGYAVRLDDLPGSLRVEGSGAAGATPDTAVTPGVAVRVMTGAPVPAGTEAVVPVEDVQPGTDGEGHETVRIDVAVTAGAAIRRAGEDTHEGDLVLDAGTLLGPAQLAAAVAVGYAEVAVVRRPRVLVLGTGDELVAAGITPGPAQVPDSNSVGLAAAVVAAGGVAVRVAPLTDDPNAFVGALEALTAEHGIDLVVTSGGVSMGAYDVVKAALLPLGVTFTRVAMQPGMPQACGRWRPDGPAYVGLPGNPVSSLVSFELFVRPLISAALGLRHRELHLPVSSGVALRSPAGRRSYLRVRLTDGPVGLVAHPVGQQGSHVLTGLARADALLVVLEGVTRVDPGALLSAIPLAGWAA